MYLVDVTRVQPDGMACLSASISETQEVIGNLRWTSNFCGPCQAQHQQIQHQTVVLHHKRSKLQTPDQTICVGMRHVLVGNHNVVLGCDVVCNVVVQHQPEKPAKQQPAASDRSADLPDLQVVAKQMCKARGLQTIAALHYWLLFDATEQSIDGQFAAARKLHVKVQNQYQLSQTKAASKPVEQGQINLLKHLLQLTLHHHNALPIAGLPDVHQVVDACAPLVHQERRRLQISWLDPVGKQVALVSLIPQVLVQVGICDLLQGLNLIHGDEVTV